LWPLQPRPPPIKLHPSCVTLPGTRRLLPTRRQTRRRGSLAPRSFRPVVVLLLRFLVLMLLLLPLLLFLMLLLLLTERAPNGVVD